MPPAPKRRWLPAICILLLVLPLVAGYWLLKTEQGARALFAIVSSLTAGQVKAVEINGSVAGPLHIGHLTLALKNQHIELSGIRLDWTPLALLHKQLHVRSLQITRINIVNKIDQKPEPLRLPESIASPLALKIDRVDIDGGGIELGPVPVAALDGLTFDLDYDFKRYRVRLQKLAAHATAGQQASGNFGGELMVAVAKPYALKGHLSSSAGTRFESHAYDASGGVDVGGSLAQLILHADLAMERMRLRGNAQLKPFSEQPLGDADVRIDGLDLAALRAGLPRTDLSAVLKAGASGKGELSITNGAAGLYDQGKLPLIDMRSTFRQEAGKFHADGLQAHFGSAGQHGGTLTGSASYADGAMSLSLAVSDLDAHRLDSRAQPTQVRGTVSLRHANGRQAFDVELSEPFAMADAKLNLALSAQGTLADARLAIERAELRAGVGRLSLQANVDLAGTQAFDAKGSVSKFRLRDLGRFEQFPELALNGDFSVHGVRQPRLTADLKFRIDDSRLAGQPLHGQGSMQLHADSLIIPGLEIIAGNNRLNANGALSQAQAKLTFTLAAPNIEQLGPGFAGSMSIDGTLQGSFAQPHLNATWKGSNVHLPGAVQFDSTQGKADVGLDKRRPFGLDNAVIDASVGGLKSGGAQVASIAAALRFSPQPDAPLSIDVKAQNASTSKWRAEKISITASGTTARHAIDASIAETAQTWSLRASGGLADLERSPAWRGTFDRFDGNGNFNARLDAPAPLLLSKERVQLERFHVNAETARIEVEQFIRDADGVVTRGRIDHLPVASLLKFAGPSPVISTDLQLGGEWDLKLAGTAGGKFRIQRQSGDVVMQGAAPIALGLQALDVSATIAGDRLDLQATAEGKQLGRIDASARVGITNGAKGPALAYDAPLSGSVKIDVPSIAWIGPMVSPTLISDGRVRSDVQIAGSPAHPRLAGRIDGSGLRVRLTDLGLDLRNGSLDSEFKEDQLNLGSLSFKNGAGSFAISGTVKLAGGKPDARLALDMQHYPLLDRTDRKLVLSGQSTIASQTGGTKVTGTFAVDSGLFDISHADAPKLSDDVVIVGKQQKSADRVAMALDVDVALGERITLKGRGLDAVLGGQIRIANAAGEPLQAHGQVKVASGTYTAYRRQLQIEQGVLRFNGALNNPALDILAMRRGQQVEAGVTVRGTVLAPRVTLVSEPVVPDAEKLSWLVLGHGLDAAGSGEVGTLQSAAADLLSKQAAAGVQSQIAAAFGLDELKLGTSQDNLQERVVTIGKKISSKLYLSYEQGLQSAASVLHLRYTLSPRLSLEAEAGARSALLLFYNISFD